MGPKNLTGESLRRPPLQLRAANWISANLLPFGWIALLTGMFWVWDRALYHKLYYASLALPCFIALLLNRDALKQLLRNPLIQVYLLFATYTLLSLAWSGTDNGTGSLIKRPLYVLLLLLAAGLIALRAPQRIRCATEISALIASLSGLLSLAYYLYAGGSQRFNGYGALYNPLLSAHVYGFFAALWLSLWFLRRNPREPLALASLGVLGVLIICTGSRTPLVGLSASLLWLALICWNKRSLLALALGMLATVALLLLSPESLTQRGLSYRPEIWAEAWQHILQKPWLGHGYDHPMSLWIAGIEYAFADPHNMELAVLYYGGAIGFALWALLYAVAFRFAWRNRRQPLALIGSTLLVFGLAAGLTEGGAFISRPKEHWFLIWIPMAILVAAWFSQSPRGEGSQAPAEQEKA
ncbi:MAG: O-antigen ligase family protein [Pseudomonas sp.]